MRGYWLTHFDFFLDHSRYLATDGFVRLTPGRFCWIGTAEIYSISVLPFLHEGVGGEPPLEVVVAIDIVFFLDLLYFLNGLISILLAIEVELHPVVPFPEVEADAGVSIGLLGEYLLHQGRTDFHFVVVVDHQVQREREHLCRRVVRGAAFDQGHRHPEILPNGLYYNSRY